MMWEPMRFNDMDPVSELGDQIYDPHYHEPVEAILTRFRAGPCFTWLEEGRVIGYVITHPWDETIPKLGAAIEPVENPTLQFLHDLAIHPDFRGRGMAKGIVAHLKSRFNKIALISVGETRAFWEARGFMATSRDVASDYFYGSTYMIWER